MICLLSVPALLWKVTFLSIRTMGPSEAKLLSLTFPSSAILSVLYVACAYVTRAMISIVAAGKTALCGGSGDRAPF